MNKKLITIYVNENWVKYNLIAVIARVIFSEIYTFFSFHFPFLNKI